MKIISVIIMLFAFGSANAVDWKELGSKVYTGYEWKEIISNDDATIYYSYFAFNTNGSTRKVWMLFDYREPLSTGLFSRNVHSIATRVEFDCVSQKFRSLNAVGYSGNMRKGKVVSEESEPGRWNFIEPVTIWHGISNRFC